MNKENKNSHSPGLRPFREIYEQWLSPVYRYLRYRTGNDQDAEDLTAQVFLKIFRDWENYQERGNLPAWIFRIARNALTDYYRSASQRETVALSDIADPNMNLESKMLRQEQLCRLEAILADLDETEQEMIRLRYVARLTHAEIGSILNRSEEATRKALTRLVERIANKFEESHETE